MTLGKLPTAEQDYPRTAYLTGKCINIVARLWHAPRTEWQAGAVGLGDAECGMLGLVSSWLIWKARAVAKGICADSPNFIINHRHNTLWDSFAQLWGVNLIEAPSLTDGSISTSAATALVNDNTIAVVATPNDDIKSLNDNLITRGNIIKHVGIHIDADKDAFIDNDTSRWDFTQPRVISISAGASSPGNPFAGAGIIIWRDFSYLPPGMVSTTNYLGHDIKQATLNFSRPALNLFDQYAQWVKTH